MRNLHSFKELFPYQKCVVFSGYAFKNFFSNFEQFDYDVSGHGFLLVYSVLGLLSVLISCGCHKKLPQTGWFKTTGINFLTVLEAGGLKAGPYSLQNS